MTRRDYILIAAAIRDVFTEYDEALDDEESRVEAIAARIALRKLTSVLSSRLVAENYRFDRDKFWLAAIGIGK